MAGDGKAGDGKGKAGDGKGKAVKGKAGNFQGTGGKGKAAAWVISAPWILFCGSWAPTTETADK